MSDAYVLPGLLPQVLRHLPPSTAAVGAFRVATTTADGDVFEATLPVTRELVPRMAARGFALSYACQFVAYRDGEPVRQFGQAEFRLLQARHRAWTLRRPQPAPHRRGAFVLCQLAAPSPAPSTVPAGEVSP